MPTFIVLFCEFFALMLPLLQNIELKVELESMKREMAEKQELLVSAS